MNFSIAKWMDSSALWRRVSTHAVSLPGLLQRFSSLDLLFSSDLLPSLLDLSSSSSRLEASSQSD